MCSPHLLESWGLEASRGSRRDPQSAQELGPFQHLLSPNAHILFLTQKLKEEAEKLQQEFGYCVLDGHREKIGNFKMEPPGLFRGRGDHPKMGMLKRRVMPEDVIINCSRCVGVSLPASRG